MTKAGLLTKGVPVPLKGVAVDVRIVDFGARVEIAQRYRNDEAQPIEAVYVFPVEEGAAVCGFEAFLGGTHVVARAEEKEKAFARYDDAMAAGHGAYLLDQERPDVFTASIGNVPPGQEVLVKIAYVTELTVEGDDLRFLLPTTVSPRHAPEDDRQGVGQTPEAALNPPRAFRVPYGLELTVTLDMPSAIRTLESPSHPLSVETERNRATVRLGGRETALDRDFVLKVRLAEAHRPSARVETTPSGERVAALAFAPAFESDEGPVEIVFVVDRSGSMEGSSIEEAKNALQLGLRSLTASCHFNIVGFGDRHELLFPAARPYDDASLTEASRHVQGLRADLGGTEILPALRAILETPPSPGRPRQVFVLTDGQVTNTPAVIALAGQHADRARVFTFGIGAGASTHLVRGLARAGGGSAEFIAPGERIEAKVLRQLTRAMAPALSDVRVEWNGLRVRQAPHRVPPVFAGGRLVVYGVLDDARAADVRLTAVGPKGPLSWTLRVDPAETRTDTLAATLAARTLIRDLEEGAERGQGQESAAAVKAEIVRLAVAYGLASKHTSLVAVEERETPVAGQAQLRRVPIALTHGWGDEENRRLAGSTGTLRKAFAPAAMAMRAMASMMPLEEPEMDLSMEDSPDLGAPAASAPAAPRAAAPVAPLRKGRASGPPSFSFRDVSPVPPASVRPLDRLVALQKADGHWDLTPELAAVLGAKVDALRAQAGGSACEAAWATALALVWLETQATASETEWRLLAKKAQAWLAKSAPARPDGRAWLDMARAVLTGPRA